MNHNPQIMPWLALGASFLVCLGIWQWANHILVPTYTARALAKGRPIANNSDLFPVWLTAREVLLQARTPYSRQLTADIQKGFYGRELDPANPSDPKDLQAFVYPLYAVFLLAPTVSLPFSEVVEVSRWFLLGCLAASVPLWMYAVGLRRGTLFTLTAMVLAVSNFPAVLEFRQQNLSALIALLLAASMAAAARHWFSLSGFLLAVSTIKPQLSGLLILWILLWAISDWKERGRIVWSFGLTLLFLIAAATAISPGWSEGFWISARAYRSYAMGPSIFQALLPAIFAIPAIMALLGLLAVLCWKWRNAPAGSTKFVWTVTLVASVTVSVAHQAAHYQPLLIPVLLLMATSFEMLSKAGFLVRVLAKATFACLLWQWVTASGLAICSLFPGSTIQSALRTQMLAEVPMYTLLALPVFTLFTVGATLWIAVVRPYRSGIPALVSGVSTSRTGVSDV